LYLPYAIYDEWNRKNPRNINRFAKAAADKASLEWAAESNELSGRAVLPLLISTDAIHPLPAHN